MIKYIPYILALLLLVYGCSKDKPKEEVILKEASLITTNSHFEVAQDIKLQFYCTPNKDVYLQLRNAYGTTMIPAEYKNGKAVFMLPKNYRRIVGPCYWELINRNKTYLKGEIYIYANAKNKTLIESYLGPPSILAGGRDYSMMVIVPTDLYDNPVDEGTDIDFSYHYENKKMDRALKTEDLIGWTNIYSGMETGRILTYSSSNGTSSKEFTTIVRPNKAANFTISYKRVHDFADGNQVITFTTSIIRDDYGNVVSDGTLVTFTIIDSDGKQLHCIGTTLSGVAQGKMLHPVKREFWTIQAYVSGTGESNTISVDFKKAIYDYEVTYTEGNRNIKVGTIKSFMNQLVPDGLPVSLYIYQHNRLLEVKNATSLDGISSFYLSSDFFETGMYKLTIEVAGIQKTKTLRLQ